MFNYIENPQGRLFLLNYTYVKIIFIGLHKIAIFIGNLITWDWKIKECYAMTFIITLTVYLQFTKVSLQKKLSWDLSYYQDKKNQFLGFHINVNFKRTFGKYIRIKIFKMLNSSPTCWLRVNKKCDDFVMSLCFYLTRQKMYINLLIFKFFESTTPYSMLYKYDLHLSTSA